MKVAVYIQGQRLDLFDDEQINVTQQAQDINDISKVFSDYSQSFTVPASKNNNQIFSHWYNADITNGFDARLRVNGRIEVNTIDFKLGKIRLDSVDIKNNQPTAYKITFFGKTVDIKQLIGEDELKDLVWLDNFSHDYDGNVVKNGLTLGLNFTVDGTLYEDAIKYPLISYQRQYFYNSDSSDTTSTSQLVNIGYDALRTDGVVSGNLKPCIRLALIVEAIEQQYGFNFNSPFFDSQRFQDIYVNLNKEVQELSNGLVVVEEVSGNAPSPQFGNVSCEYEGAVIPDVGFEDVPYKIKLTVNDQVVFEHLTFVTGTNSVGSGDEVQLQSPDFAYTVKMEVITQQDFSFTGNTRFTVFGVFGGNVFEQQLFANSNSGQTIDLRTEILNIVPDIKVLEFITNLFKIFNLTATAEQDDIFIQDLQSWYSEGEIFDVTEFVDFESENITRGKIYRDITFKFKESEQILWEEFNQSNDLGYGDLEFILSDANGQPLTDVDGESLEIEAIFENPIHERLLDTNTGLYTTVQYCPYFNRQLEPIAGNMFMMYLPSVSVASNSIGFVNDGAYEEISSSVFMPSHSQLIDADSFNVNFNAVINEYTFVVMLDTIYKRYWDDYIVDMFSIKRRIFDFKAILPDYLLQLLNLNDRLIIKDRRYIINNITSNLVDREDSLQLINDIYDAPLQSDTLNTSVFRIPVVTLPANAQTTSVQYIGLTGKTVSLVDTGDGIGWLNNITKTTNGTVTEVLYSLTENNTGIVRSAGIQVTDGLNNPIFYIIQKSNGVTVDSTTITVDNNIIKADNG